MNLLILMLTSTKYKYDVALSVGVWDLLHKGHAELFNLMRKLAYRSVVFVHDDLSTWKNKGKMPAQNLDHRMANLRLVAAANAVLPVYNTDPSQAIKIVVDLLRSADQKIKIAFVRGDDWKDPPGSDYLKKAGIPIVYKPYTKDVSSTKRRKQIKSKDGEALD